MRCKGLGIPPHGCLSLSRSIVVPLGLGPNLQFNAINFDVRSLRVVSVGPPFRFCNFQFCLTPFFHSIFPHLVLVSLLQSVSLLSLPL